MAMDYALDDVLSEDPALLVIVEGTSGTELQV